jgi:hypothetical protein
MASRPTDVIIVRVWSVCLRARHLSTLSVCSDGHLADVSFICHRACRVSESQSLIPSRCCCCRVPRAGSHLQMPTIACSYPCSVQTPLNISSVLINVLILQLRAAGGPHSKKRIHLHRGHASDYLIYLRRQPRLAQWVMRCS